MKLDEWIAPHPRTELPPASSGGWPVLGDFVFKLVVDGETWTSGIAAVAGTVFCPSS